MKQLLALMTSLLALMLVITTIMAVGNMKQSEQITQRTQLISSLRADLRQAAQQEKQLNTSLQAQRTAAGALRMERDALSKRYAGLLTMLRCQPAGLTDVSALPGSDFLLPMGNPRRVDELPGEGWLQAQAIHQLVSQLIADRDGRSILQERAEPQQEADGHTDIFRTAAGADATSDAVPDAAAIPASGSGSGAVAQNPAKVLAEDGGAAAVLSAEMSGGMPADMSVGVSSNAPDEPTTAPVQTAATAVPTETVEPIFFTVPPISPSVSPVGTSSNATANTPMNTPSNTSSNAPSNAPDKPTAAPVQTAATAVPTANAEPIFFTASPVSPSVSPVGTSSNATANTPMNTPSNAPSIAPDEPTPTPVQTAAPATHETNTPRSTTQATVKQTAKTTATPLPSPMPSSAVASQAHVPTLTANPSAVPSPSSGAATVMPPARVQTVAARSTEAAASTPALTPRRTLAPTPTPAGSTLQPTHISPTHHPSLPPTDQRGRLPAITVRLQETLDIFLGFLRQTELAFQHMVQALSQLYGTKP